MKRKWYVILFAVLFVMGSLQAIAQSSTWTIDPMHSEAGFVVRHMGVSNIHGSFSKVTGTVVINDKDITKSSINATIDTTTVDTRNSMRDTHLKSKDFFDVTVYPTMTFKSTKVVESDGKLQMIGDLTLHGVTRPVTIALDTPSKIETNPQGKIIRGFSGTTSINRRDFGLVWGGTLKSGDAMVGDQVKITLDVELDKQ
ncbi:MAG: YceI family protein [Acidobacteriaceae bacterium]